jgi:hypothetical protein
MLALLIQYFRTIEPLYLLFQTKQFYLETALTMLFILLIWETNRFIIVLLDKRYPWPGHQFERFIIQFALVLGVSFVEVVGFLFLYNEVLSIHPQSLHLTGLLVPGLPLTLLFVLLINLFYTGIYLVYYHHFRVEKLIQERDEAFRVAEQLKLDLFYNENNEFKPNLYQKHLIVNAGYASVPVPANEIAYIFKNSDTCCLKTFEGKEYTSHSSLENLETLVNPDTFFRINRQMLANAHSIKKIQADKYGELEIDFTPPFQHAVFVCKKKALQFKQWLGKKI